MVIDDDDVDAAFARQVQRVEGGDAVVDGDDEAGAESDRFVHAGRLESVPVDVAVGQQVVAAAAHVFEKVEQQGGAAHAVDVVIAVDDDRFVPANGALDAFGATLKVGEQFRRMQALRADIEFSQGQAAGVEYDIEQRAVIALVGQLPHGVNAHSLTCRGELVRRSALNIGRPDRGSRHDGDCSRPSCRWERPTYLWGPWQAFPADDEVD